MWKIRFRDRSKIYQVPFIDSHCHIDLLYERLNFNGTYKEFLQRFSDCYPSNFAGCIAIFCYPRNFELSEYLLAEEENVWISIGCHPKNAIQYNEMVEDNMLKIFKHPKVVAVGEIGLDYYGNQKQFESIQKSVFKRQLKIGLEVKKPIVIHCRDAEDDCLQIMEEIIPRNYKIQCHCFSGNYSQAKRWLSAFPNLYLGLTPVVTFNGAHAAHDVARNIPLNRLLLETDSPYFVPKPVKQVISLPGFALTVAEEVAHRRGISVQEVLRHCRDNMTSLFGI
ncbi:hypothetical protein LOTGIDRAFT_132244 [Lottia gigantea]|uniref:Uncharacterized protein n=1 Tax=Lottia gigantea TaxID=225164 RepID=V3ZPK7_LOTGI|nr:hypothetical protein LOTGIDRAFT_132244 [Lottia gigantea]ESO84415.1 hypothetical protein LOTGIDRAFT_132244 [Lottia gigantea]